MENESRTKIIGLIAALLVVLALIGLAVFNAFNTFETFAATTDPSLAQVEKKSSSEKSDKNDAETPQDIQENENDSTEGVAEEEVVEDEDVSSQIVNEEERIVESPNNSGDGGSGGWTISGNGGGSAWVAPSGGGGYVAPAPSDTSTSGPGFSIPGAPTCYFNDGAAAWGDASGVDFSSAGNGYIGIRSSKGGKLKAQVQCGGASYNYPLPSNNTPIFVPCNMGCGNYTVKVMLNTSGTKYVQVFSTSANVGFANDRIPFTTPTLFASYSSGSACVAKARELAGGAANQGDAVKRIYQWMASNIRYDNAKAANAANMRDYIPNPDATLASRTGICFDYASLAAAMFRSIGIPCKVMTGYVSPNNLYHSWNMVFVNGSWHEVGISVNPNCWNRIDITFAAGGSSAANFSYQDRYSY